MTPLSPFLLKGALVELPTGFAVPIPNVVVFQYNPEKITRRLEEANKSTDESVDGNRAGTSSPHDPREIIELTLELDATDDLEFPDRNPIAVATGVADRLAALQNLMYPSAGLLGNLLAPVGGASLTNFTMPIRPTISMALFAYGPGLIVPVRLTSFSVEQQQFSTLLYPIQATVSLTMEVLQPGAFPMDVTNAVVKGIAEVAYFIYRKEQHALAIANMANNVESILGLLPI